MSATHFEDGIDYREQLVRIDRAIAETRKFQAESDKLRRDRVLAPWTLVLTAMGAGAALFAAGGAFLKLIG